MVITRNNDTGYRPTIGHEPDPPVFRSVVYAATLRAANRRTTVVFRVKFDRTKNERDKRAPVRYGPRTHTE